VAQVWAIVVAGGSGRRFGQMKQFALLDGRPVLEWAVEACRPSATGVVLVVPGSMIDSPSCGADALVAGGATRSDSVRAGLAAVPASADIIVVHDAARPLASPELFRAVISAVTDGGADGAIPGLPVGDTIKVVDGEHRVTATLERGTLTAVQTPQAFRADVLRRAHAAGGSATDDAALVELLGGSVQVVPGDRRNLKLTTPEDLCAAERLLANGAGA
jgi:2-C-methyl-D-erythritol 4-phosphate cytidylyltransferase